jgi:hypothetical protein
MLSKHIKICFFSPLVALKEQSWSIPTVWRDEGGLLRRYEKDNQVGGMSCSFPAGNPWTHLWNWQ